MLSAALSCAPAALGGETVRLEYGPRDGAVYEVAERFQRVTSFTDRQPVTDVRNRKTRVRVARTDVGYANSVQVLAVDLARDGRSVASPVFSAMEGLTLTYHLTPAGELSRIAGYGELADAIRSRMPGPLARTLAGSVRPDSMRQQEESAYRMVYGHLAGSELTLGVARASASGHALPYGGATPLYSVDVLTRDERDGRLRLVRRLNTDAAALASQFDTIDEAALTGATGWIRPIVPDNQTSISVEGSEETVVDPDGLLVASQRSTLRYAFSLRGQDGDPVPFRIRDTREFTAVRIDGPEE